MSSLSHLFAHAHNRWRAGLLLAVFVLFVLNALGVTDIRIMLDGDLALRGHVLKNMLHGQLTNALQQSDFLVFVLTCAVLAFALPHLSPLRASALTLVCMLPPFYIAWTQPLPLAIVPLEYTLLAILILFAVNVLSSYFIETHQRQKIVDAFGQYVPPLVVDQISRQPDAFSMAGEARELSVLFSDIKQF